VVSNTRGGAVLGADACGDAGLQVATLAEDTQRALRDLLPDVASVAGPVNTTAAVAPGVFRRCLELIGADPGVDAVLVLTATTATSDLVPEVRAPRLPVPIAVAVLDQVEAVRLLPGREQGSAAVPAYAYPESAARALGHAARYGMWRATPPGNVPDLDGVNRDRARELADSFLAEHAEGGWLPPDQATELLSCYGIRLQGAIVPRVITGGAEVKINVLEERVFGPLVLFGLAEAAADTLADRAARLAPLTESDADQMIRSVPALVGRRGAPAADIGALKDMLLRVSQLAEDLPQVAELELNPVVARPDGAVAVSGLVRIQAAQPADSYLRRLR
jgi:acyl-CoA synthetase (NDP forming)